MNLAKAVLIWFGLFEAQNSFQILAEGRKDCILTEYILDENSCIVSILGDFYNIILVNLDAFYFVRAFNGIT